ncbi:uncharacterized protein LOC112575724 [Pomacea canaliculata]|uniref:uncharacterized protein LOC112575724 n=1 Tax=Pomacea canaliculata TaxID=400727 RepID=UPI000D73D563|nr:uncharacterized protein LOC112575724 [Pomacea canaliculata]
MQYGGTTCQRLIRDCTEPYESGHRLSSPGKVLLIQPAGTAVHFPMICILDWGGVGYALARSNTISFNANWTTAKTWIGDNLSSNESDAHYFIGLENLHNLLSQANYQANLHYTYNSLPDRVTIPYTNFAIGPKDSCTQCPTPSPSSPTTTVSRDAIQLSSPLGITT